MTDLRLDRCEAPPCPKCGCQDLEIAKPAKPRRRRPGEQQAEPTESWWGRSGQRSLRARCRHCGRVFHIQKVEQPASVGQEAAAVSPQLPPIVHEGVMLSPAPVDLDYKLVKKYVCPSCKSERVYVTTTRKAVRYFKCRECNETFKRAKD